MPEAELKRGDPEGVCREYLRGKAAQKPGGTSMAFDQKDMVKSHLFVEEGYPPGFSLGVPSGRQVVQLLLTDKDHPDTEVIAQISIEEIRAYLRDRMEKQLAEAERMINQATNLLRELDKEKP